MSRHVGALPTKTVPWRTAAGQLMANSTLLDQAKIFWTAVVFPQRPVKGPPVKSDHETIDEVAVYELTPTPDDSEEMLLAVALAMEGDKKTPT